MAPPLVRSPSLRRLLPVSVMLLAGCSPWWQRQPASQDKALRQQCQALETQRLDLEHQRQADAQGLAAVTAEAYQPSPAPKAPDPELASRFSQLDREIDDERYASAIESWRQREHERLQRWIDNQRDRRQRMQQRLNDHNKRLSELEPRLRPCRSQR